MNNAIEIKNVKRAFGASLVLKGIDVNFPKHGIVGIVGPSGSGKSTLLNILSGLDQGYSGGVFVLGKSLKKMNEAKRRRFRLSYIGYVFQNFRLLELETAEGNVLAMVDALYQGKRECQKRKARDLLSFFGMEKKARQKVNTLSGGEKQRVALARALSGDPKILLCDEPTGSLEAKQSDAVFALLRRCASNRLVIVVSHDEELARKHCDLILGMKDGRIVSRTSCNDEEKGSPPRSYLLSVRRERPRLSSRFLFSHAFQAMKAKKWRSILSQASISIGLSGLGLSVYISTSISDELNAAFESLVPPNTLIMMPRGGNDSPIGSVYGAGIDECEYIVEEYGDLVRDYGTDLHMDYESWFIDRNDFTFESGAETVRLNDFSIRSINDFRWLDLVPSPVCYPRTPAILYEDQVVLGLPYQNMFTTCLDLHILRNYQALGDYIDAHGLNLCLNIANYEYGFDDQELYSVVAVMESDVPCFYHLDHHWNHKIIVDQLRFRSNLSEDTPNPQYIFEIPYISIASPLEDFLSLARRDENLTHLIYEKGSYVHNPTLYLDHGSFSKDRLYIYGADKTGVSFKTLDTCMEKSKGIAGRQPVTSASYFAQTGSVAMGFAGKFYVCKDAARAEEIIDAYSDLPRESAFLPGEEIEGTKDGSYFGSSGGGIRLSSNLIGVNGAIPTGVEECVLSTALYKKWGEPKEIYVSAEIGAEEIGETYVRRFGMAPLKITGTKECDYDTLYVEDDWTVDFYMSLGVSSFSLEPYGAVFSLKDDADSEEVKRTLEKEFPSYEFSNPAKEIASSIESTLGYIGVVLTAFSFIALAMSALLFLIVMAITVNENKAEVDLFSILGVSKEDVLRIYEAHAALYAFSATIGSLFTVALAAMLTKAYLSNSFHAVFSFSLPWQALGLVILASLVFSVFIMLGISINLHAKMSKKHL